MTNLSHKLSILRKTVFRKRRSVSGFTLLELLISMIVAGIVVSGLLYVVVELLQIDRREAVLDRTQQNMQRAMNYMADDVKEAVYIYDDPSGLVGELDDLPTNSVPVLAFWRPVPVEENLPNCDTWAKATTEEEKEKFSRCQVLEIRQASYSLVLYLQKEFDDGTDTLWKGASRIIRYELDQYEDLSQLKVTPGYQEPTAPGVGFRGWTSGTKNTKGNKAVLADYVDVSIDASAPSSGTDACAAIVGNNYTVVPKGAFEEQNRSFFSCVRGSTTASSSTPGGAPSLEPAANNLNQDVYIFLRGNAADAAQISAIEAGKGGGVISEGSVLPTLETRVLMRGVLNKNPD